VAPGSARERWPLELAPAGKNRRYWRRGLGCLREFFADPHDTGKAFEFYFAVSQGDMETYFQRFAASHHGPRLLAQKPSLTDAIRDRDALAAMPGGSLGRAFLAFIEEHGYQSLGIIRLYHAIMQKWQVEVGLQPLDADRMWFVDRYMASHDLHHIVTGYGPDELGEASLSAFTLGQHYGLGLTVLTMGAVMQGARELGLPWLRYARGAWRRGRRARPLYAAPWEELLPLPLDLVCEMLAIEPSHRAHPGGIWAANFNPPQASPYLDEDTASTESPGSHRTSR
jgi:ubiquinone biosynthesis protein COQ4